MADVARIGNLQRLAQSGADEVERVTADIHVAEGLGDFRHVTGDALVACVLALSGW
jgi:hypothetical protein